MSLPTGAEFAEAGMQEAAVVSGAGSSAGVALPKLPSWGASGWQALFKQPSAGTANLTDMLADPGAEGSSAQLGAEAGASPLFKWTSDGSMMEELMKAYKDSSPGTPTFGGGAQSNSIFRDGSLYKDGSITSCLQAAFQAQMEEEEHLEDQQEASLVNESEARHLSAPLPDSAVEQSPANPPPFTFTAVGADTNDSPQLHVPELQLGPQLGQQAVQDIRQPTGPHSQAEAELKSLQGQPLHHGQRQDSAQTHQQQQQPQLQHQPPQSHQQPQMQQLAASQGFAIVPLQAAPSDAGQVQLQTPLWLQQPSQYQHTSQAMQQPHQLPYNVSQQQPPQLQQLQGVVLPAQSARSNSSHVSTAGTQLGAATLGGSATHYGYPNLPGAAAVDMRHGDQAGPYGPRTVITSGAMGSSTWSRPNSRPVSPGLQAQGVASGAVAQVLNADGSTQAVPRIVIRTSTPSAQQSAAEQPKQGSPPQSQQPVVLNSRVVQEPGTAAPEAHPHSGYASTYAPYAVPQHAHQQHTQQPQHQQHPQAYGMHQYQQAQQPQHQQRHVVSYQQVQNSAFPAQQQSAPRYQAQQHQQSMPRYQAQQQQQDQPQRMPRPGSFQELLSAPVLPEQYNSAPLPQEHNAELHAPALSQQQQQTKQQQQQHQQAQQPAVQSTAIYSGQVVHGAVATRHATGTAQGQYSYAPITAPGPQQMAPVNTGQPLSIHAYRQQQQQHQQQQQQQLQMAPSQHMVVHGTPSSSDQYSALQTSSPMYPSMQFPAQHASMQSSGTGGFRPMQAAYGHPYHGQSSQAMDHQVYGQQQQQHSHHRQGQQQGPPPQQGQQYYAQGSLVTPAQQTPAHSYAVTHQPDANAQAVFRASSGFPIPPVAQSQAADEAYNDPAHVLEQRSRSDSSSQASAYQQAPNGTASAQFPSHAAFLPTHQHPGHGSQQGAAANTAQGQHQAAPTAGFQPQGGVTQPQHSAQAGYQLQQPAHSQAGSQQSLGSSGSVWKGTPGPAFHPGAVQAVGSGPMMRAELPGVPQQPAQQMTGLLGHDDPQAGAPVTAAATAEPEVSHGTVLLTSRPVASSEDITTGKVVSFAPELREEQQQNAMPSIPGAADSASSAKENIQDQASQQGPPPQPGRKFKRDRSSRKNSFSLPPMPPKKQASAAVEFSPASSVVFALQGAASAPLNSLPQDFPAELAAANMRHSASCQDMMTDNSCGDLPAAVAASEALAGGKSSRSSSADVIFCADGIDFNSRAWKMMSRKEKNRASAAASRARREAYTESLEDKVRKLQAERDWLQEQIEPGSVHTPSQSDEPMQLPTRPPVRHLSL